MDDLYFLEQKIVKALLRERFLETAFNNTGILRDAGEVYEDALKRVDQWLAELPPADVKPVVRGKWIPVTNGRGGHECDQCHEYAPSYQSGSEYLSNFCPNCGGYNGGDISVDE